MYWVGHGLVPELEHWQRSMKCCHPDRETTAAPGLRSSSECCRGFSTVAQGSAAFFPSTLFRIP